MATKKRKQSDESPDAISSLHIREIVRIKNQQGESLAEAAATVENNKAKNAEALAAMCALDVSGVEQATALVSSTEEQSFVDAKRQELLGASLRMLTAADEFLSKQDETRELVGCVGDDILKELLEYEEFHTKLASSAREARQDAEKVIQVQKSQMELDIQDFGCQRSAVNTLAKNALATISGIHAKELAETKARQQLLQEDLAELQARHRRFLEVHEPQDSVRFKQNESSLQDLQQSFEQCQLPRKTEELFALATKVCNRFSQPFVQVQEPQKKKNKIGWWRCWANLGS